MKNKSVMDHSFGAVPVSKYPRSVFNRSHGHKTAFDSDYLIPILGPEPILPGDTISVKFHILTRLLSAALKPVMDNVKGTVYTFFVPYRILWTNFIRHMGEQDSPSDSISYNMPTVPTPNGAAGGVPIGHLFDYFGVPTEAAGIGGAGVASQSLNNLPGRAYNKIWHDHFRDENLQNTPKIDVGDGPDTWSDYGLLKVGKKFDYFTSCVPNPQKGATAVSMPLGTSAPIIGDDSYYIHFSNADDSDHALFRKASSADITSDSATSGTQRSLAFKTGTVEGLTADLSSATAATINSLRESITLQQFLERDARSGTRYQEIVKSHFAGVVIPDFRAQRSEIIHLFNFDVKINPVAQTNSPGGGSYLGDLAAFGTAVASGNSFTHSFNEHGVLLSLIVLRGDITYSQGIHRNWRKSTRYDHYWPIMANLGEQAVLNEEIYSNLADGTASNQKSGVFGYIPRYDEYRYANSKVTGLLRPGATGTLGIYNLSELFSSQPTLGSTFIQSNTPLDRCIAVPSEPHWIVDCFFDIKHARIMPVFAVPGLHRL